MRALENLKSATQGRRRREPARWTAHHNVLVKRATKDALLAQHSSHQCGLTEGIRAFIAKIPEFRKKGHRVVNTVASLLPFMEHAPGLMFPASVDGTEGADALRHNVMADWKVKPKTSADHRRDWEDLQATVPMQGTAFYTENQFLDAMLLQVGVHHESRIEKYRAAVVKRQDLDLATGATVDPRLGI